MKKKIFLLVISALLFSGLLAFPQSTQAKDENTYRKAPRFTLPDLKGNNIRLSDFHEKVILVDFWATWCYFCRSSIPILTSLYEEYKDRGFEIVGIALEYDGGKALKKFAEENKIPYTLLIGTEDLAKEYSAFGVPTRFLVNRKGEIVERFIGFKEREIFETAIKKLL